MKRNRVSPICDTRSDFAGVLKGGTTEHYVFDVRTKRQNHDAPDILIKSYQESPGFATDSAAENFVGCVFVGSNADIEVDAGSGSRHAHTRQVG